MSHYCVSEKKNLGVNVVFCTFLDWAISSSGLQSWASEHVQRKYGGRGGGWEISDA